MFLPSDWQRDKAVVLLDVTFENIWTWTQDALEARSIQLDTLQRPTSHHSGSTRSVHQQSYFTWDTHTHAQIAWIFNMLLLLTNEVINTWLYVNETVQSSYQSSRKALTALLQQTPRSPNDAATRLRNPETRTDLAGLLLWWWWWWFFTATFKSSHLSDP